ncbi:PREDICTED: glycylpeptide N-tetradecanoyltransferase 1-like [Camelina sativa]|uniref:Glycylpeptide N-tetradecanoyltransferase n=1 Tax=Camelina sativa TaxID=90675 RepID=A0ABM0ZAR5_CAMSA|nr:PREDICTED: glycylpeptide N-tetradecanoyltransferase 1-like [Camelina sativa]
MSKSQPMSKEEKADQIVEANPLAKDDTSAPRLPCSDIGDTSLTEGPVEPATPLSEVRQEPYELPSPALEWTTCDLNSDDMCSEVCNFLNQHYADVKQLFKENYTNEFLRWALCPPGYYQSWHIGVRAKTSKKLVAFISGVPERIRVHDEVVKFAKIDILCVQKSLRSTGIAHAMIKEVTRRVQLEDIWQATYSLPNIRAKKPVTSIVSHCQYWIRMLNPQKLVDTGFISYRDKEQVRRFNKANKLPDATVTPGIREMELHDVLAVTELLRNYLRQFRVKHWLLPRENVVHCYVVECPVTHAVTDFCSTFTVSLTIDGNLIHKTVEIAYSYYNVTTQTPLPQLMKDALIVSNQKGIDVLYALDVMHNETFLEKLKFNRGDSQMHYYLYNYRLTSALKPSELGLVF